MLVLKRLQEFNWRPTLFHYIGFPLIIYVLNWYKKLSCLSGLNFGALRYSPPLWQKMILNSSPINMYYYFDYLTSWQASCLFRTILSYLVVFIIFLRTTIKKAACENYLKVLTYLEILKNFQTDSFWRQVLIVISPQTNKTKTEQKRKALTIKYFLDKICLWKSCPNTAIWPSYRVFTFW